MTGLASLVDLLFTFYIFLIFARVILSFARIDPYHPVAQWIMRLTEPLLGPIRNLMPQTGMVDFSPMIAMFVLIVLRQIVLMFLQSIQ
jgi:YggT family protein